MNTHIRRGGGDLSRTVLITGAGSGIGAASVAAAVRAGHRVAVADIDVAAAERVAAAHGAAAIAVRLDVRDEAEWSRTLDRVEAELGPLDVLVNNAGIIHTGVATSIPLARHRDMIDVNLLGPMTGILAGLARMKPRGRGHIIDVCSMTSFVPLVGYSSYSATKHALRAFHHSVALEERDSGVSFTIIHPPSTRTPMLEQEMADETAGIAFAGKSVAPEEIAAAVVSAIDTRPREVVFPALGGQIPRLFGAIPAVTYRAVLKTERDGLRNRERMLRRPEGSRA